MSTSIKDYHRDDMRCSLHRAVCRSETEGCRPGVHRRSWIYPGTKTTGPADGNRPDRGTRARTDEVKPGFPKLKKWWLGLPSPR